MVDRRERRNVQDGQGKDRQPERYFHYQRQGLGRDVESAAQGHMGLYDWPAESPRQPGNSEKARRNISLKLRFDLELDEWGRVCLGARFSPKEIKVAPDGNAASEGDVKRLKSRIGCLYPSLIFTVLNDCVMHLQLPFRSYYIISAITFEKQVAEDPELPIIVGIVNQRRFWEHAFQTEVITEQPNDTTAGGDDGIRIDAPTHADDGEDLVFFKWKRDPYLPRNVD